MAETKRQEHRRLQRRTDELKQEHAELSLDRKPFNRQEHHDHSVALKKHLHNLKRHRQRAE